MLRISLKLRVALFGLLLCLAFPVFSASTKAQRVALGLPEAVALALQKNADIKSAYLQRVLDKFTLQLAKDRYRLQPSLSVNEITTSLPHAFSDASDRQFGVTPGVTWDTPYSTNFAFSWSNTLNNGVYGSAESLTVTQPLLRGFGKQIASAPLNDALDQEIQAKMNLRQTLITTITQVITDYYALQQAEMNIDNAKRTLKTNQRHLYQDRLRVKAGELAPTELSQDEYQVEQQKVQIGTSENAIKDAQLRLSNDLGLDQRIQLILPTKIRVPQVRPNQQLSEKIVLANNIAYQQALLGIKQAKRGLLVARDNARWNLTMEATAARSGSGFLGGTQTDTYLPYAASSNTVVANSRVLLRLDVPLGQEHLQNREAIAQARISLKNDEIRLKQQRLTLTNQVDDQVQRIKEDLTNIHLAEKALALQRKTLQVTKEKIAYGMTSNFELFSQQNSYDSALQTVIQNKITYLNDLAQFDSLLGTTLNTWNIKVKY